MVRFITFPLGIWMVSNRWKKKKKMEINEQDVEKNVHQILKI